MDLELDQEPHSSVEKVDTSFQTRNCWTWIIVIWKHNLFAYMVEVIYNMRNIEFFVDGFVLMDSCKPFNYQKAMSNFESDIWLRVMNTEMQSMYNNQVWAW